MDRYHSYGLGLNEQECYPTQRELRDIYLLAITSSSLPWEFRSAPIDPFASIVFALLNRYPVANENETLTCELIQHCGQRVMHSIRTVVRARPYPDLRLNSHNDNTTIASAGMVYAMR